MKGVWITLAFVLGLGLGLAIGIVVSPRVPSDTGVFFLAGVLLGLVVGVFLGMLFGLVVASSKAEMAFANLGGFVMGGVTAGLALWLGAWVIIIGLVLNIGLVFLQTYKER